MNRSAHDMAIPDGAPAVPPASSLHDLRIPLAGGARDDAGLEASRLDYFATQDLDAFRERMCSLFRPHSILSQERKGLPKGFELGHIMLGNDLMMSSVVYDRRIRIEAPPLEQFYVFQFTMDGACRNYQGSDCSEACPGTVCALNSDTPIRQDMTGGYHQMAMRVSRSMLEGILEEDLGYRVQDPLTFTTRAVPLDTRSSMLVHVINDVWRNLQSPHSICREPAVQDRMRQTIGTLLLASLPHNYSDLFARSGNAAAPYFVRRSEQYMRANAAEKLTLEDIAAHADVSPRTLQNGFRRFRGTSPMAYLKSIRLSLARNMLLRSREDGRNVTDIAFDCGFTHLSKFAQDYRAMFGEKPSDTVRQSSVNS